jgi:hypothetical protein
MLRPEKRSPAAPKMLGGTGASGADRPNRQTGIWHNDKPTARFNQSFSVYSGAWHFGWQVAASCHIPALVNGPASLTTAAIVEAAQCFAALINQKISAEGGRYLTGRLGGVKVLILANKARQSENDPSHILYFVDGEQRHQGPQERGVGLQAPKTRQTPPQPQRGGFQGHAGVDDDDAPEWP